MLGARFSNLIDYCGTAVTLFHCVHLFIRKEKDVFRQALHDFGLDWVMHMKHYLMTQQLLLLMNKQCPIYLPPLLTFPNAAKLS